MYQFRIHERGQACASTTYVVSECSAECQLAGIDTWSVAEGLVWFVLCVFRFFSLLASTSGWVS